MQPDGATLRHGVEEFFRLTDSGFHFGHSTVLYRLDRLRAVGMFDPSQRRRHDIDLWIRMIAERTWTYDTVKSVGYRENTPGSLSKDEAECDYFYLRALVKNLGRAQDDAYCAHLARQARRAMGIAFVDGPAEHYAAIRELAWPHLAPKYRLLLSLRISVAGFLAGAFAGEAPYSTPWFTDRDKPRTCRPVTMLVIAGALGLSIALAGMMVLILPRPYYRRLCYDSDGDEFVMPAAAAHYARVRELAWRHLPLAYRLFTGAPARGRVWLAELSRLSEK